MRSDRDVFMSFRFCVLIPNGDNSIGVSSVYTDPFTGALWIGSAHMEGRRTLGQVFAETKKCEVWMFPRGVFVGKPDVSARKIDVSWSTMRWVPFNLDATKGEIAMEYVCLEGATYTSCADVPASEFPLVISKTFSPTVG